MTDPEADHDTERSPRRTRRRAAAAVAVVTVVGIAAVIVFAGAPGPGPLRRPSAGALEDLADHIDHVCGTRDGPARIDWISGHVDFPNGTPIDLSADQQAALGGGPKVGCVEGAIS